MKKTATLWLMYHVPILDLIDSGRIMTEEEEARFMAQAEEDNAYILKTLVQYKKFKDRHRS